MSYYFFHLYIDVRTLLAEERQKTPCSRFQQNVCKFGAFCRFSHFTLGEIENMQQKGSFFLN